MAMKLQEKSGTARTKGERDNAEFAILVQRASRGNREALMELCETIARGVLFRTTRILGNQDDAEDLTQEVILCVCSHIHELRAPEAFYVWLNKIIMNEANRFMAKNSRHGVLLNIDDYQDAFTEEDEEILPHEYALRAADRKAVIEIIDKLPGQQRKAILLHYYDGLTLEESARVMGVSQPRVSRCLKFAIDKIKKEFAKQEKMQEGLAMGLAMFPLESLLTQVLHQEAALFNCADIGWTQAFINNAAVVGGGVAATAATAAGAAGSASAGGGAASGAANPAGFIATIAAAAVVSAGILVGAPLMQKEPPPPPAITAEYEIFFSGGSVDNGSVNPSQASARAYSPERGEMSAVSWQITAEGDSAVLYSGEGDVDEALAQMKESGEDGSYFINFEMEDSEGDTWTLSRKFTIETG